MVCGLFVCVLQYRRYQANPTVVSVERDFYDWNGTLPSLTFCYEENLSLEKADEFIKATWGIADNTTEKYWYYKAFLTLLLNSNIFNVFDLLSYAGDSSLDHLDFEATINSLTLEHDHYLSSFIRDVELIPQAIQTERGICYTVNSLQSDFEPRFSSPVGNSTAPIVCNFVQDQCFMKLDIFGLNASIAIHSYYEPLRYETFLYPVFHDEDVQTTFKLLETVNDELVRELSYSQRKCLFYDEMAADQTGKRRRHRQTPTIDGASNSIYSLNLCLLECRAEKAIALCGCKPHFYPFLRGEYVYHPRASETISTIGGVKRTVFSSLSFPHLDLMLHNSLTPPSGDGVRTCNLPDFKCLADRSWPVIVRDVDCNCPKTCNHLSYTEGSFKLSTWNVDINGIPLQQKSSFRVEVLWPRMRLRRDVLFTFADLVVSFGGAVTLFIGSNFLDAALFALFTAKHLGNGLRRCWKWVGRAIWRTVPGQ